MSMKLAMMILVACCIGLLSWVSPVMGQGSCTWEPVGGGLTALITAMAIYDDGTGPALYAGGTFTTIGGVAASRIARWDGVTWSAVGSGLDHSVKALCVFDDGTGPALHVGGVFGTAGGLPANHIARWNGATWSPLGAGCLGGPGVSALAVFDDGTGPALYAVGSFDSAGGQPAASIARWDGSSWFALGAGLSGWFNSWAGLSLASWNDGTGPALYAGGFFSLAGGMPASKIARWDGISWSPLGSGVSGTSAATSVHALQVFDDGNGPALFAQGYFTSAGGLPAPGIAKWDGGAWSGLSSTSVRGTSLLVFDDGTGPALFASVESGQWVAKWDGSSLSQFGLGFDSLLGELGVFDSGIGPQLYVCGIFSASGSTPLNGIARWSCPGTITLTSTQPGGAGSPIQLANTSLTPSREYHNVFSLDSCFGGPGTGPHLGMCLTTQPNYLFILNQLQAPLGTPLFHFIAQDSYTIWGGYQIPPMTVDGIVFDFTGGVIGAVSPVTRIVIQ